jgi:hypothetical protein
MILLVAESELENPTFVEHTETEPKQNPLPTRIGTSSRASGPSSKPFPEYRATPAESVPRALFTETTKPGEIVTGTTASFAPASLDFRRGRNLFGRQAYCLRYIFR